MVDIAIIGGGASGLMAAVSAAVAGGSAPYVVVFESQDSVGRKLLATGGGRCNLTNTSSFDDFIAAFGRHGRFMQDVLRIYDSGWLIDFFNKLGVECKADDGFHYFPRSEKAIDVLSAVYNYCLDSGVEFRCNFRARDIALAESGFCITDYAGNEVIAKRVVIATGGKGYPALGAKGDGFRLAESLGYKIVTPMPAMVPLIAGEKWCGELAGIGFDNCSVYIDLPKYNKKNVSGAIMFTQTGISGPAIIDISSEVSFLLQKHEFVPLAISIKPEMERNDWQNIFSGWRKDSGRKVIKNGLKEFFPEAFCKVLCSLSGVDVDIKINELTSTSTRSLIDNILSLKLSITKTEGFDRAMVTRGGVSLKGVDPKTLEGKVQRGLYFSGEVLDLNGPCGGYNLQWAFSSGYFAGKSAAESL